MRVVLQPDVEELKETVLQLRAQLGIVDDRDKILKVKRGFGIPPQQARLLLALHAKFPKPVRHQTLFHALYEGGAPDGADPRIVTVVVSNLRRRLGCNLTETFHSHGYALTGAGKQRVDEALA